MSNVEIARLVTAVIISAMAGYAIGFIIGYIITWHSAIDIFDGYKIAIAEYKAVIETWKEIYEDKYNYTMMGTYDFSIPPDDYFSEQEAEEMLRRIE